MFYNYVSDLECYSAASLSSSIGTGYVYHYMTIWETVVVMHEYSMAGSVVNESCSAVNSTRLKIQLDLYHYLLSLRGPLVPWTTAK